MMKLYTQFFAGAMLAMVGMAAAPSVHAQATSEYSPLIRTGYTDYKTHYAPTSDYLARSSGEVTIATSHGNIQAGKVKVFVPPGAKRFTVSFQTYAIPEEARAAARFGQVPVSTVADVTAATAVSDTRRTLSRLMGGEELRFYAPPSSGGLTIANSESTDTFQSASGGYIYLNLLSVPGNQILNIQTRIVAEEACYLNWYANASWDYANNPSETAGHACSGSTGGGGTGGGAFTDFSFSPSQLVVGTVTSTTIVPTPVGSTLPACTTTSPYITVTGDQVQVKATTTLTTTAMALVNCGGVIKTLNIVPATTAALTDVGLSATTLNVGSSPTSLTLTPIPSNAVLPTCTVASNSVLSVNGATVSLNSSATNLAAIAQETLVCGSVVKTITVKPLGATARVQTQVQTDSNGLVTLQITLTQPADDIVGKATTAVWLAAKIPANGFFFTEDQWFFRTAATWRDLDTLDVFAVAFDKSKPIATSNVFAIPLGFKASELQPFNVEIQFGYANNGGQFQNMGKVWSSND